MAETAVQYFSRICKEAGKSDADIAALLAIAQDPSVASKFDETVRRATDDFSAMQGRVTAAERKVKQYDEEWYPKANSEYQKAVQEAERLRALVNGNGYGPNGDNGAPDMSRYLTKADMEAMNKDRDARYAMVIKQAAKLASLHAAKFGEGLDVDAVEKIAIEKNLTLDQAYREFIEPRESVRQKEAFQKEKEEFANQKVRDYASQHKLPVDPVPSEVAPMFRSRPEQKVDVMAELESAWNGARSK